MSDINFLKTNFKPKYEKLVTGTDYNNCFSEVDGWLFYNSFEEVGALEISKEVRQKEWDYVRLNREWWTNTNRLPNRQDVINHTKANLFRDWIIGHSEIGSTCKDIFSVVSE